MRTLMMIAAMVLTSATAFADAPLPALATHSDGVWHARTWHEAVATLPCYAFQKKSNGQWTMAGRIKLPNHGVIMNVTFGPDRATRALEKRCRIIN